MIKRYYYDDLLAAFWMAEKFGMNFQTKYGRDLWLIKGMSGARHFGMDGGKSEMDVLEVLEGRKQYTQYAGDIYVHPGSVYLLDAQIGDLTDTWDDYSHQFETIEDAEDLDRYNAWKIDKFIVKRNGIAFFTPREEA